MRRDRQKGAVTVVLASTWVDRDLPVLIAAARLVEEREPGSIVTLDAVSRACGMAVDLTAKACLALDPTYLVLSGRSARLPDMVWIKQITDEGREAVGLWPAADTLADRIVCALEQLAAQDPDEDTRSRAQRAASALGTGASSILTGVLTHVLSSTIT